MSRLITTSSLSPRLGWPWRITALLALGAGLFTTGCETANPQESSIPWARPADWEGGAPGIGGGNMSKGRTGY